MLKYWKYVGFEIVCLHLFLVILKYNVDIENSEDIENIEDIKVWSYESIKIWNI